MLIGTICCICPRMIFAIDPLGDNLLLSKVLLFSLRAVKNRCHLEIAFHFILFNKALFSD